MVLFNRIGMKSSSPHPIDVLCRLAIVAKAPNYLRYYRFPHAHSKRIRTCPSQRLFIHVPSTRPRIFSGLNVPEEVDKIQLLSSTCPNSSENRNRALAKYFSHLVQYSNISLRFGYVALRVRKVGVLPYNSLYP